MISLTHINVRYSEGGAAKLARTLHNAAQDAGIQSQFWYGYGPGIGRDSAALADPSAHILGSKAGVIANFAEHSLLGTEHFPPHRRRLDQLAKRLEASDVVHLHAVHSYFLPFETLTQLLSRSEARVIWTLHDFWPLTGRCAIPAGCDRFFASCGRCPKMDAYPSARVDLSRWSAVRRQRLLYRFADRLTFVAPSRHVYESVVRKFPVIPCTLIPNSVDNSFTNTQPEPRDELRGGLPTGKRVLFVATDLQDPAKRIAPVLRSLSGEPGLAIITVGENSPVSGENIVNFGRVNRPDTLARIYRAADATIFTSQIDTFGMVMAESLVCGTPVLAYDSPAAREVLGAVGGRPVESFEELRNVSRHGIALQLYGTEYREVLAARANEVFGTARGVASYLDLYHAEPGGT